MSDPKTSPQDAAGAPDGRGRRAVLAAGAGAALGVLGVAAAPPAAAAAGAAMLIGRVNAAGATGTTLASTTTGNALWCKATAGNALLADTASPVRWGVRVRNLSGVTGGGGAVRGDGVRNLGVYGSTNANASWGMLARNLGARSAQATGGALRAEGRNTMALFADTYTAVTDIPAITALGGDGEFHGTALVAGGTSYFDGEAKALRNYVGVLGAGATPGQNVLFYAPVASGEEDYHTVTEAVTLDGGGGLIVDLANDWSGRFAAFLVAVDMTSLHIALTPVGQPMPTLHAVWTPSSSATSFGIAGGAAAGTVHFTITAKRVQVSLADVGTAAATAMAPLAAPGAGPDGVPPATAPTTAPTTAPGARVGRTIAARRR